MQQKAETDLRWIWLHWRADIISCRLSFFCIQATLWQTTKSSRIIISIAGWASKVVLRLTLRQDLLLLCRQKHLILNQRLRCLHPQVVNSLFIYANIYNKQGSTNVYFNPWTLTSKVTYSKGPTLQRKTVDARIQTCRQCS